MRVIRRPDEIVGAQVFKLLFLGAEGDGATKTRSWYQGGVFILSAHVSLLSYSFSITLRAKSSITRYWVSNDGNNII